MSDDVDLDRAMAEADEMQARLRANLAAAEARAADATRIAAELAADGIEVWSPGREVRVRLGANGLLEQVEYGTRAEGYGADGLATLTLRTVASAMRALQERAREVAATAQSPDAAIDAVSAYENAFRGPLARIEGDDEIRFA